MYLTHTHTNTHKYKKHTNKQILAHIQPAPQIAVAVDVVDEIIQIYVYWMLNLLIKNQYIIHI